MTYFSPNLKHINVKARSSTTKKNGTPYSSLICTIPKSFANILDIQNKDVLKFSLSKGKISMVKVAE